MLQPIRTGSCLVLAVALCASPALAQSISEEAPAPQGYDASAAGVTILHAQIDGTQIQGIVSQHNETAVQFDNELADDFLVPPGETWYISQIWARGFFSGPAQGVPPQIDHCPNAYVFVWEDDIGTPGDLIAERETEPEASDGDLTADFDEISLSEGEYWIGIVCFGPGLDVGVMDRWNWFVNADDMHHEPAHIRNDGGGFGLPPGWNSFAPLGFPGDDLDWYIAGEVKDVSTEPGTQPTSFSLLQNTPNPVAGSTTFRFVLDEGAEVSLIVYDVLGRTVADVFSGELAAGEQSIAFDASNLSAGTYFYRLQSGNQFMARKMTVVN